MTIPGISFNHHYTGYQGAPTQTPNNFSQRTFGGIQGIIERSIAGIANDNVNTLLDVIDRYTHRSSVGYAPPPPGGSWGVPANVGTWGGAPPGPPPGGTWGGAPPGPPPGGPWRGPPAPPMGNGPWGPPSGPPPGGDGGGSPVSPGNGGAWRPFPGDGREESPASFTGQRAQRQSYPIGGHFRSSRLNTRTWNVASSHETISSEVADRQAFLSNIFDKLHATLQSFEQDVKMELQQMNEAMNNA